MAKTLLLAGFGTDPQKSQATRNKNGVAQNQLCYAILFMLSYFSLFVFGFGGVSETDSVEGLAADIFF